MSCVTGMMLYRERNASKFHINERMAHEVCQVSFSWWLIFAAEPFAEAAYR